MTDQTKDTYGWIGLGAMGWGMATSLASQGYRVQAYDVYPPSIEKAVSAGCVAASSPAEAAKGARVLGLMVVNVSQVEDILFGPSQVANALPEGASIVVYSTCPPSALKALQDKLDSLGTGLGLVDSPVSGGSTRAADGTLAIMVAGSSEAIKTAAPMIESLTRSPGGMSVVGNKVGMASDFKLINQVYCAIQICVTGEGMAFAKALGLNPRMTYNIIRTASGDSFMFGHRVPWQWESDAPLRSAMTIIVKDIGIVMDEARLHNFPAPLSSITEQVFTAAMGAGLARVDDGNVIKLWEKFGVPSSVDEGTLSEEEEKAKELDVQPGGNPGKVLVVGLGVMGLPMAITLLKSGFNVVGADLSAEALKAFEAEGGRVSSDVDLEAQDSNVVLFATVSAAQAEAVLFGKDGSGGIASVLPSEATVILTSTVAPSDATRIEKDLQATNQSVHLVDAPISGGPSRASKGDLSIMASGESSALSASYSVLKALSSASNSQNLHFIPGGVGFGSKMKAVNQLLAGIHIAATAEATAFARKKGMDLEAVYEVVSKGAASSYCMKDRGPRMRQKNPPVLSATTTFVKDLGIVLAAAKAVYCPLFLASAAHQQFIRAASYGWEGADDSCVGRLWEYMGVDIRDFD